MINLSPTKKAAILSFVFFVIGLYVWVEKVPHWKYFLPVGIFYLTIIINTFFSVRLFLKIIPRGMVFQNAIDALLIIIYIISAFNMDNVYAFTLSMVFLFIIAAIKYVFLLGEINYPLLLKRKILVDLLGTLACTLSVWGILSGYEIYSIWGLSIVFVISNILLFFVWPLYSLD